MVFLLLPWIELGIAVALIAGAARWGAVLAIGLLGIFCVAIARARLLLGTDKLGCGCFGGTRIRDYRLLLARNVALAALAAVVSVRDLRGSVRCAGLSLAGPGALLWLMSALALIAVVWVLWQAKPVDCVGGITRRRSRMTRRSAPEPRGSLTILAETL